MDETEREKIENKLYFVKLFSHLDKLQPSILAKYERQNDINLDFSDTLMTWRADRTKQKPALHQLHTKGVS